MQKEKFIGTIQRRVIGQGSKSEQLALVLETGGDNFLHLRVAGDNLFKINPALEALVGKKVFVTGVKHKTSALLLVENVADVVTISPLAKKYRPLQP